MEEPPHTYKRKVYRLDYTLPRLHTGIHTEIYAEIHTEIHTGIHTEYTLNRPNRPKLSSLYRI